MFDVKFSDVKIYQISSPTQADFAPIGTKTDNYVVKLLPEQKSKFPSTEFIRLLLLLFFC